jgi:hypothetical protein
MKAALEADDDVAGVTPGGGSIDGGGPTEGEGGGYSTGVSHLDAEQQAALADDVADLKASTPAGSTAVFDDGDGTRFHLDVDTLFATRVHGGISELPHPIEPALRVAAAIGLLRKPSRVVSLLHRR